MQLTTEFLNNTEKNVWTLQEIIDSYGTRFSQLKAFCNIPIDILSSIKITQEMIRDINHWHGMRLIDVLWDLVEIHPSDYKIKGLEYEGELSFYLVDDERKKFMALSAPFRQQIWCSFEDDPWLELNLMGKKLR